MADQQASPSGDGAIWVFLAVVSFFVFTILFHIGLYARPIGFLRSLEVNFLLLIPFWTDDFQAYLERLMAYIEIIKNNPDSVRAAKLFEINDRAGALMNWVYIPILAFFTYKMLMFKRFRKSHSMETLRGMESSYWGRTKIFSKIKLDTINLFEGEWAIAKKPHDFALDIGAWDPKKNELNLEILENVLKEQIGKPLHSKKGTPTDLRVTLKKRLSKDEWRIFVLFCVRVQASKVPEKGKKAETVKYNDLAESLVQKLGHAYADEDFDALDKELNAYFIKFGNSEMVRGVAEKHYYVTTFFAGLLEQGRATGVFASADFIWLKKCNRTLWYLLNNVGRRVGWAECAGPWSHYLGESKAKYAMKDHNIRGAVEGFAIYVTR